jgi:hypothetical protein
MRHGDFLICGDFNATVGTNSDCIIQDDSKFLPLGDSYTTDKKILNRRNKDLKIDKRGRDLLDFCIGLFLVVSVLANDSIKLADICHSIGQ